MPTPTGSPSFANKTAEVAPPTSTTELEVGDVIGIGGPRNNFRLTPATALPLRRRRDRHHPDPGDGAGRRAMGASWELLYGGRSRSSMAYLDELEEYGDRVQTVPQDELGLLDLARPSRRCPTGLACTAAGRRRCSPPSPRPAPTLPPGALRVERFVAQAPRGTGAKHRVRGRAGIVGNGRHRPTRRDDRRRTRRRRRARADLLPARHLRHLRDRCRSPASRTIATRCCPRTSAQRSESMFVCVSRSCSDRLVLDL